MNNMLHTVTSDFVQSVLIWLDNLMDNINSTIYK